MPAVFRAWGRALGAQLSGRMLLLSILPFLLSMLLWGVLLYLGFQPLLDTIHGWFARYGVFGTSATVLAWVGMGLLKAIAVPLAAMLLLLPLMIITALLFMAVAAMPAIGRFAELRLAPSMGKLEARQGGNLLGSLATSLGAFLIFILLWVLSLPLYLFPPVAVLAQVLLWGWLTARVMSYDALAGFASAEERRILLQRHRRDLLIIGIVSGVAGALPGMAWVGGALISVVLFPVLAMLSIWLYVIIFMFTGLWFYFYLLPALHALRAETASVVE
jgi:hypothetical protein